MSNTPKAWQVLATTVIHSTPWIEIVEDRCLIDGKEITYTYTRRLDEGPLIIAEEKDGRLWLVQQYRHPIKKLVWQFPIEGKIAGESWQTAAERGLHEELQLTATTWHNLGQFYPDPGGLEQKYTIYVAQDIHRTSAAIHGTEEEIEDLRVKAFSRSEIENMIKNGEICDNWTLAALFIYDHYKSKNK